jgi:hypothetical protein
MAEFQPTSVSLPRQHVKEYNTWKCMRSRCSNPRNASWRYYGGKGITVCQRWQESFVAFLTDVGAAPSPDCSIERMDNARGYEPGNCHWATPEEQAANTSKVRYLEFRGVRLPILEMARLFNVPNTTLRARLGHLGWDVEKALLTPADVRFRPKKSR